MASKWADMNKKPLNSGFHNFLQTKALLDALLSIIYLKSHSFTFQNFFQMTSLLISPEARLLTFTRHKNISCKALKSIQKVLWNLMTGFLQNTWPNMTIYLPSIQLWSLHKQTATKRRIKTSRSKRQILTYCLLWIKHACNLTL